jgi:hypothetical protein
VTSISTIPLDDFVLFKEGYMILFYIDESGTGLGDVRSPYFVLAAIAISATDWPSVDSQVTALKRRLISWARPEDWEIKGRDLRRGEKFFRSYHWPARVQAIHDIAELIALLPCYIYAVQVDKRHLPEYVGSDDQMYRLSLARLLEEIELFLTHKEQVGMLMLDMRSDMHSSVQDRRIVDAYRDWVGSRSGQTHLVELPWFGFSAFYAGLQLADFSAYLVDFASNEAASERGSQELKAAYAKFRDKVRFVHIP